MERLTFEKRHGGANGAPARVPSCKILSEYRQAEDRRKRADKWVTIKASSVGTFHKFEKSAFQAETVESERVTGFLKIPYTERSSRQKEIKNQMKFWRFAYQQEKLQKLRKMKHNMNGALATYSQSLSKSTKGVSLEDDLAASDQFRIVDFLQPLLYHFGGVLAFCSSATSVQIGFHSTPV